MKIVNEKPAIIKYFNSDNLAKQNVYKTKKKYIPLYINKELYEKIFKETYDEKKAFNKISDYFSITLDRKKSNNELLGVGYADKQYDPMGISLSGNEGSGRAFFYGKCFNIKGDKTTLATSPKKIYSNGKLSLLSSIRETIVSNILAKELIVPTFKTLAILDTLEDFQFINEYLASDDTIKEEKIKLPRVIEIRVYNDKELYRISNAFKNNDLISYQDLMILSDNFAKIEAQKFTMRFLHGSWSVGNISTEANLIDFDTSFFVKGRNPQYSNTCRHQANYFGYEIFGSKNILKLLFDHSLIDKEKYDYSEIEKLFDNKYHDYLLIGFCNLIGLDYDSDYQKYQKLIDELFNKYNYLSRKFLPNYYDLCVLADNSNTTCIYDFSNFFQKFLISHESNNLLNGINLLLNDMIKIDYEKVGYIKDRVNELFSEYLVNDSNDATILTDAIDFVNLYIKLFNMIKKQSNIDDIIYKQYLINMNREYLYGFEHTENKLSSWYRNNKIDNITLNKIINSLILVNNRNYNNEHCCNLKIKDNYLTYMVLSKEYYSIVLVPYTNLEIRFAKLIIEDEEYMMHHENDKLVSERIEYHSISEIDNLDFEILIGNK